MSGVTISGLFTCPFTLCVCVCVRSALPAVCVYVRSVSLTSQKLAPFHHLAGFPRRDRWSSNLPVDYTEKKGKWVLFHKSTAAAWDYLLHTSKALIPPVSKAVLICKQLSSEYIYSVFWVKIWIMALQLVKFGCQGKEMFSARGVVSTFVSGEMKISYCCCWKRKMYYYQVVTCKVERYKRCFHVITGCFYAITSCKLITTWQETFVL